MTTPLEAANPRDDAVRERVVGHLWVIATLFHMTHGGDLLAGANQVLTLVCALLYVLWPGRNTFACYLVAHAGVWISHAPNTGNHEFFAFIAEVVMLITMLTSRGEKNGGWFATVAPILRAQTIVLYFFAVLHKLNTAYLGVDSCGAVMPWNCMARFASPFGDPDQLFMPLSEWPTWIRHAGIWGSLIVEASVPILFFMRRTWLAGFVAGFALHFFLAACFFWHFTPLLWALYLLFAPREVIDAVAAFGSDLTTRARDLLTRIGVPASDRQALLQVGVLVLLAGVIATHASDMLRFEFARYARGRGVWSFQLGPLRTLVGWLPFLVYSVALLVVAARAALTARSDSGPLWHFPRPVFSWCVIAILLLNGFSPYLGLKTHHALAMFANLVTHEGRSNHLFMPQIDLLDHQQDIAQPVEPNRSIFGGVVREGRAAQPMVYRGLLAEVKTRIDRGERNIRVAFRRNGEVTESDRFEKDPRFRADEPSWLAWKFQPWKPVPAVGNEGRCTY